MAESVYKIIEIVGTSSTSWEKAAAAAVERAAATLRDLRVAEVCEQDVVITDGKVEAYRVRLQDLVQVRRLTRAIAGRSEGASAAAGRQESCRSRRSRA